MNLLNCLPQIYGHFSLTMLPYFKINAHFNGANEKFYFKKSNKNAYSRSFLFSFRV